MIPVKSERNGFNALNTFEARTVSSRYQWSPLGGSRKYHNQVKEVGGSKRPAESPDHLLNLETIHSYYSPMRITLVRARTQVVHKSKYLVEYWRLRRLSAFGSMRDDELVVHTLGSCRRCQIVAKSSRFNSSQDFPAM